MVSELLKGKGRYALGFVISLLTILPATSRAGDQLLMTLQVDSSQVRWQDEFILSLEIYGEPSASPPQVTIDGLDQFQVRGQGQNLLQVPGGKTVKWILTYTLIASQDGTFKLGPAKAVRGNRTYNSNTLFITVERSGQARPKADTLLTPLIHSAREVEDRVLLLLEAENMRPYRSEGTAVTLRLLSQLPVENLRFLDEAEFPGFLKYDFPYSDRPRAELVTFHGQSYAAFDLQKFLVFPLHDGQSFLPPFRCEISISVPSGSFAAANLKLDVERSSNPLAMRVKPLPVRADLVGDFRMQRELVSDDARTKTVRIVLEGQGLLSTFAFPDVAAPGAELHTVDAATNASLEQGSLHSRKTAQIQVFPTGNTTDIVLPAVQAIVFNPQSQSASVLSVPPLPLRFAAPPPPAPESSPLPRESGMLVPLAWLAAALSTAVVLFRAVKPQKKSRTPGFASLFRRKKPHLEIPKTTAQNLYQQIAALVAMKNGEEESESLTETLKLHIPEEDWAGMEDVLLRLEWTAFSQTRTQKITYGELKDTLLKMEKRWLV